MSDWVIAASPQPGIFVEGKTKRIEKMKRAPTSDLHQVTKALGFNLLI